MGKPRACLCGATPEVLPHNPDRDGNAWGAVRCVNPGCPAQPIVCDGEPISDERGSEAYKQAAIKKWNEWIAGDWGQQ